MPACPVRTACAAGAGGCSDILSLHCTPPVPVPEQQLKGCSSAFFAQMRKLRVQAGRIRPLLPGAGGRVPWHMTVTSLLL